MEVKHPETGMTVAVLKRTSPRKWLVMLCDMDGHYWRTGWHRTRREGLMMVAEHLQALGVRWKSE